MKEHEKHAFSKKNEPSQLNFFVKYVESSTSIWTITLIFFFSWSMLCWWAFESLGNDMNVPETKKSMQLRQRKVSKSGGRGAISPLPPLIQLWFWNFGLTNSLFFQIMIYLRSRVWFSIKSMSLEIWNTTYCFKVSC